MKREKDMSEEIIRLQCPKCKSKNCAWITEEIHLRVQRTNKNGTLLKGQVEKDKWGENSNYIHCYNCGHEEFPLRDDEINFIVSRKEKK